MDTNRPPCECSRWAATINGQTTTTNCTATTKGGRFAPGHDARLKSLLRRADTATRDNTTPTPATDAIATHFPNWVQGAPKLPRRTRTRTIPTPPTPRPTCDCGKPATHGSRCRVCALMDNMAALEARRTQ